MIRCAFAAALPDWQGEIELELPAGATAADALAVAATRLPRLVVAGPLWRDAPIGVFGELCGRDRVLQDGDRLELYRPLAVDPKAARRARALQQQTGKGRNPLTPRPSRRR
jgi:putative ubiquitin-RnfH superfamily antitoxin RatB of RatAB toxin-antitoxin module